MKSAFHYREGEDTCKRASETLQGLKALPFGILSYFLAILHVYKVSDIIQTLLLIPSYLTLQFGDNRVAISFKC